ncbi:competence type IV pilus assembly protein ComGB [Lysinibacillus sp. KU-BSD001]|uniref:competence type IV pilus assembly protein ComGB n=1 Tax=Lysinibacillus sp. KU-BSD001 TaxID=3141328 RepID=UPI0036E10C68
MLSQLFVYFRQSNRIQVIQLPQLLSRTSILLEEGYTFAECIEMLLPYHVKDYSKWKSTFEQVFQDGVGPTTIFALMGMKRQYLLSIELAEMTGNLPQTLAIVGNQVQFAEEIKQRVAKLLVYPVVLFMLIIGLFIVFRLKFLPNIQQMMYTRVGYSNTSSIQWSKFFLHMPDYIIVLMVLLIGSLVLSMAYVSRKRIDLQLALLLKLPFIRYYWRLLMTRQFSRTLGELLLTGFSLQAALEHLMTQPHQKQLAYIASVIQQRVIYGDALSQAVLLSNFFYPKFHHFIAHGEQSGLLGRELILYVELLDSKLQNGIKMITKIVQPMLFIIIAICIVAAYLSILLPMYNMLDVI